MKSRILTRNVRNILIFAALAIIAFFPTRMLSAASNGVVGTWSVSGINNFGFFMTTKIVLSGDGSGSLTMADKDGNVLKARSFAWSLDDSTLCMRNDDGSSGCMNVDYVNYINMSLSSRAGTTVYTRNSGQVPFGGSLRCCKTGCSCSVWHGSDANGNCKNPKCQHSKVMHADASGCTYH